MVLVADELVTDLSVVPVVLLYPFVLVTPLLVAVLSFLDLSLKSES